MCEIFAVNLKTKNQNPKSEFPNSKSGVPNFEVLKSKIEIGNPKSKTKSKPPTNTQDTGNPKSEIQNLESKIQTPDRPPTYKIETKRAKTPKLKLKVWSFVSGLDFGCWACPGEWSNLVACGVSISGAPQSHQLRRIGEFK